MPRSDLVNPSIEPGDTEDPAVIRRRRVVVATTLLVGTGILAGTLAAPSGSGLFFVLGLAAALTWIAGAYGSGPIPLRRGPGPMPGLVEIVSPILLGAALFGAFSVAKLVANQVPFLSQSVANILDRTDAGPRALVLAIALANGVGEEMFFRGALYSAFVKNHPAVATTVIYGIVTVATLNVALVASAVVMGAVFATERRATGGILSAILTHLTWSTFVIFLLPR